MSMVVVTGTGNVLKRLYLADKMGQAKLMSRLGIAARHLQRASMKIAPVDENNLLPSAFNRLIPAGWNSDAIVGYTAEYAVFVHEDLDKAHGATYNAKYAMAIAQGRKGFKRKKPNEQAKFLEKPARDERAAIRRILITGW